MYQYALIIIVIIIIIVQHLGPLTGWNFHLTVKGSAATALAVMSSTTAAAATAYGNYATRARIDRDESDKGCLGRDPCCAGPVLVTLSPRYPTPRAERWS